MLVSWGKPDLFLRKIGATNWMQLPTPVEGTTQMETSKGDKKEAKVEGGENEDVKYTKSTYAINFDIRSLKDRKLFVKDVDGVIAGEYEFALRPEDADCYGILVGRATLSCEVKYTAEDGITRTYTIDALKPTDGGKQVETGTITVNKTGEKITSITCEEEEVENEWDDEEG